MKFEVGDIIVFKDKKMLLIFLNKEKHYNNSINCYNFKFYNTSLWFTDGMEERIIDEKAFLQKVKK